jgi:hypothetical protein
VFLARGVQLVGVSQDSPADSKAFADEYGIQFPLLSDQAGELARAFTGIDGGDNTIPGVAVIRRDGAVVFRKVASTTDDRLNAAQLITEVDRVLGTSGTVARGGYASLERLQVGVEVSAGSVEVDDEWRLSPSLGLRVIAPLGRYAFGGLTARTMTPRAVIEGGGTLGLRVPLLSDVAAVQIAGTAGVEAGGLGPFVVGGRIGVWLAMSPRWAWQLDAVALSHRASERAVPELAITFGVSRLLRWR